MPLGVHLGEWFLSFASLFSVVSCSTRVLTFTLLRSYVAGSSSGPLCKPGFFGSRESGPVGVRVGARKSCHCLIDKGGRWL